MTTARAAIYRALRMIGVADPEEVPSSAQAANGLEALNQMVHGWRGLSVDVGHADWTLDDDVTGEVDQRHVGGMVALLAITLLPEYPGAKLPAATAVIATEGWTALQAAYLDSSEDSDLVADMGLMPPRLRGGWYNGT